MLGKMSIGVRRIASGPMMRIKMPSTMNVYGRDRAMRISEFMGFGCGRGAVTDAAC